MSDTSKLSAPSEGFLSQLSTRERLLVSAVISIILIAGVAYGLSQLTAAKNIAMERTTLLRAGIAEIKEIEPRYLKQKQRLKDFESRLTSNSLDLGKVMEKHSKTLGFSIDDFKERRIVIDETRSSSKKKKKVLVAYTQDVTIRTISLDQLAKFLQNLERERVPVKVTALEVKPSTQNRQELKYIRLSVTTYKKELDQ
jgi:hypothetical protein